MRFQGSLDLPNIHEQSPDSFRTLLLSTGKLLLFLPFDSVCRYHQRFRVANLNRPRYHLGLELWNLSRLRWLEEGLGYLIDFWVIHWSNFVLQIQVGARARQCQGQVLVYSICLTHRTFVLPELSLLFHQPLVNMLGNGEGNQS